MTSPVAGTTNAPPTTNSNGTTSTPDAMSDLSSNFSTFLTLLTTQLKNQDPTSPMDSSTFTQQLVEFSQVEQQINTNSNLQTLITQGGNQAGAMANNYLGKAVSVTNGQASLASGAANWTYSLNSTAANTALTVTNSAGKVVYSGLGETAAGNHTFAWNGKDNNGNAMADGAYKLTVTAKDSANNDVADNVASAGVVSQIDMTTGTPQFVIGNMEVGLADIGAIAN